MGDKEVAYYIYMEYGRQRSSILYLYGIWETKKLHIIFIWNMGDKEVAYYIYMEYGRQRSSILYLYGIWETKK